MGPLAIGTDGGGSVESMPYTGLFGIKPTFGKIPAWPLSPFGTIANVGPMQELKRWSYALCSNKPTRLEGLACIFNYG